MHRIIEAERSVVEFLEGVPLMGSTVKTYKSCYRTILIHCERNDIGVFGLKEAELYNDSLKRRFENGEICRGYYQYLRRSAALLADQMERERVHRLGCGPWSTPKLLTARWSVELH